MAKTSKRERIKNQILNSGHSGWSAIKAMKLAKRCKKEGCQKSKNSKEGKSLRKWIGEKWQYSNGKKSGQKGRYRPKKVWQRMSKDEKKKLNQSKYRGNKEGKQNAPIQKSLRKKANNFSMFIGKQDRINFSIEHAGEKFSGVGKPKRTPNHPKKSHAVLIKEKGKYKIVRFGEQGAKVAGAPKKGESDRMKKKRKSFKARHARNIAKGKTSAAYWANRVKWIWFASLPILSTLYSSLYIS